tara:strand:+ start:4897 stop:9627 length:4731 start_codon:yes stop_codon:yes gene_type:complete
MKFLIKQISPSRNELRITLNPVEVNGISSYIFGSVGGTFDEGSLNSNYTPPSSANFHSVGPNPGVIRLIVAYLKDNLGTVSGFKNTTLKLKTGVQLTIVNIAIDDISLTNLTSDTLPSMVIKLTNPLPPSVAKFDEVTIEEQIITTQEQEVYYISATEPPAVIRGLAYDEGMVDTIGNTDLQKLTAENYNELTSSFQHSDKSLIAQIISGSDDLNLKIDYSKYENHTHFGSAVSKLENFRYKVVQLENYLNQVSQSLSTGSLESSDKLRAKLFDNVQNVKNTFTHYEKNLYYKSDTLGHKYNLNIGANYIPKSALSTANSEKLINNSGFDLVYKASGSVSESGHMELFKGKYNIEDKPLYNYSSSFYLSFLMKGDEELNGNIKWVNNNENYIPKIPFDALYTSSISSPLIQSESWNRYIYHASMSYWAPHSSNPIVGTAGTISDFSHNSSEVTLLSGDNITGSYSITAGGRYSNLATTVTSSGIPFIGSIVPVGELFRIYADTSYGTAVTSSYLTDIKLTKFDPSNFLPFSEIYSTGSTEFINWYDDQYTSASLFDLINYNNLTKTLPEYFSDDSQIDNIDFRKFVNMMGEHFDLIKNYIDGYGSILKTQYGEVGSVPENLLPVIAESYNWQFMLPFGKKEDADLLNFFGSSISNMNNTSNFKNNIWRNIVNNIKYIYKTKGTHNSIRALLNSYGFPPDILKIREHGASLEQFEDSVLSDDVSNLTEGLGGTGGNLSFTQKEDKLVSYIIDSPARVINAEWRRDSVTAEAVEFVFKPVKGTNTEKVIQSSGSAGNILWDVILQPSASSNLKGRLQFRLNISETGSLDINTASNRISMSTSYQNLRNQNHWNVLLQRNSGSNTDMTVSHSYQLYIGEQDGDKVKVLEAVSMSFGGTVYSQSAANWAGTGSRHMDSGSNLVIGGVYTGSFAELRTWKYALSASKFKQHVFDKKSVASNSITGAQGDLFYHYRLNENWSSGSSNPKIKDYNTGNVKDYSIDISTAALGHTPLYDTDIFDRIQFSVGVGGSYEVSDNNIIIDNERRFINNLNPTEPSVMNVYHPLINKRKASSTLEITRSPQEVINDFILNQLGNFDFNDKFADPQDVTKDTYRDLEVFAKEFFDYYDISLDVNKFIEAQAAIFTKELVTSIKRLAPARAVFSKIGVELKPTYLERQKLPAPTLEKQILSFEGDIPFTDWGKDKYSLTTIVNLDPANLTKNAHIEIASHKASIPTLIEEYVSNRDGHIEILSPEGTSPYYDFTNQYELYQNKDGHIEIASHTSSIPTLIEEYISNRDAHIEILSPEGTSPYYDFTSQYELYKNINSNLNVIPDNMSDSNSTSSFQFGMENKYSRDINVEVASATKSTPDITSNLFTTKNGIFYFIGADEFKDRAIKSYSNYDDDWGTGTSDVKFMHYGYAGTGGDYNTYHYENRFIFHTVGDVESISGSYPSISSSFETDFTGTVDAVGGITASVDFTNQIFIKTNEFFGLRPLGTTVGFKSTGSIDIRGGKFLDETFVYPANHIFVVGTSKDSIDRLIYKGTQNTGGETIESEAFTDLSTDAFYYITTTGESGYTVQYN